MPNISKKPDCCGCRACEEICPHKAIKMVMDEESFYYPEVETSKCCDCHLCEKVCPLNFKDFFPADNVSSFVGTHKSQEIIYNSSSGGAFTALCEIYVDKGYSVCGVKFDEHLKVIHDFANTLKECEDFRKSKYIQSNTNHCFSEIAKRLKRGESVLFSGVSCQVAALYSFLKIKSINTEKLITVNLLCHGVPSQKMFDDYIAEEELNATEYQFRYKDKETKSEEVNSRAAHVKFSNGKECIRTKDNDAFLRGYYSRLFYRPSCAVCRFTRKERISDITIADAWNIEKIMPEYNPLWGASLILLNSEKSKKIISDLSSRMNIEEIDSSWAINSQRLFRQPTVMHKKRDEFFERWPKIGFHKAVYKCTRRTVKQNIIRIIPLNIRNFLKKFR